MPLASSNATSDVYVAAWSGAVGANLAVSTLLGAPCRAIRIGTGGVLVVVRPDGTTVTIPAGPDGETIPIQAKTITAAGSAAYNLLLLA